MPSPSRSRKPWEAPEIEASFASAGLPRAWWKFFAKDMGYCSRCGKTLRWRRVPVEGRNRFICDACRFIAYQNPKVVAATLPLWRGKIVLLRRALEPARGRWTYPAGFMELGETVEAAAVRETREEIRCRVRLSGPARLYSYDDAGVVTVVYPARVVGPGPRPGGESLEVRPFGPTEVPWRELAFRSVYHALRDWADGFKRGNGRGV